MLSAGVVDGPSNRLLDHALSEKKNRKSDVKDGRASSQKISLIQDNVSDTTEGINFVFAEHVRGHTDLGRGGDGWIKEKN